MNKKEIIKKWKKSGLLDNLTKMDKDSPMLKVIESIKEQRINEFPNIEPMNKVNEAGYNESTKFGPSENNPPYISDDFQIGPDGAYEHNEIVHIQQQLIDLLYSQVIDLSMMSKIELGDNVIAEIKRLKSIIDEKTT